jgi:hypothetical protein
MICKDNKKRIFHWTANISKDDDDTKKAFGEEQIFSMSETIPCDIFKPKNDYFQP